MKAIATAALSLFAQRAGLLSEAAFAWSKLRLYRNRPRATCQGTAGEAHDSSDKLRLHTGRWLIPDHQGKSFECEIPLRQQAPCQLRCRIRISCWLS